MDTERRIFFIYDIDNLQIEKLLDVNCLLILKAIKLSILEVLDNTCSRNS